MRQSRFVSRFFLLCFSLCVCAHLSYGAFADIKSFQADFIQTVSAPDTGTITYQGHLIALSPHSVRWTYTTPSPKTIYITDHTAIIYEPRLSQATITRLDQKTDFLSILQKAILQTDGRYRSQVGETTYYLTLKDDKPYLLEFQDSFDNTTKIRFLHPIINAPINASEFVFTPPDGIDIISQ
ncbi:hypothetical protein BKH46_05170 [Helicobacter sp. 12S02634-8]|uniref:LolA-like outer membrane lipoprotein chaperone n=1 Tax=Helicobacter sp. 12S02634-8 TaxID=1476199 RepID=UPI000BA76015|nr:LolA-like outer membrane lipoprotein chaperone [Helicobacter sp. 12S02634-8]PAF47104.1 hypothetical protein BKH46_05170 [Helicobacter sp. 12S02634-8]